MTPSSRLGLCQGLAESLSALRPALSPALQQRRSPPCLQCTTVSCLYFMHCKAVPRSVSVTRTCALLQAGTQMYSTTQCELTSDFMSHFMSDCGCCRTDSNGTVNLSRGQKKWALPAMMMQVTTGVSSLDRARASTPPTDLVRPSLANSRTNYSGAAQVCRNQLCTLCHMERKLQQVTLSCLSATEGGVGPGRSGSMLCIILYNHRTRQAWT